MEAERLQDGINANGTVGLLRNISRYLDDAETFRIIVYFGFSFYVSYYIFQSEAKLK